MARTRHHIVVVLPIRSSALEFHRCSEGQNRGIPHHQRRYRIPTTNPFRAIEEGDFLFDRTNGPSGNAGQPQPGSSGRPHPIDPANIACSTGSPYRDDGSGITLVYDDNAGEPIVAEVAIGSRVRRAGFGPEGRQEAGKRIASSWGISPIAQFMRGSMVATRTERLFLGIYEPT